MLSVYVIHWNAPDWLERCVDSLRSCGEVSEVVVVDNGPPGALPQDLTPVRLMRPGTNLGFAGAANEALADWFRGDAEYCVICSHDVLYQPDALRRLVACARRNPDFGALAPELTANWLPQIVTAHAEIDERRVLSGGCLLLRRACIAEVGGFDEAFQSYGEDQDISLRIARAGWRLGTVRGLVVTTLGTSDPQRKLQLDTAATVLLGYKTAGVLGAIRGGASGIRKAALATRRQRWSDAGRLLAGTQLGVRRVARYRGHVQSAGPRPPEIDL